MHVVARCNNREFYFGAQESHVHWIHQASRLMKGEIQKLGSPSREDMEFSNISCYSIR
jgi:hypothetical protein